MKIVAATNNKHKLEEFKSLLKPLNIEIFPMSEIPNCILPVEDGVTFEENAIIKAMYVSKMSNGLAFSDDSGIVVDTLNGAPGIYSARYAGENATDLANLEKLIIDMKNCENRKAKFVCVIALTNKDKLIETFYGEVCGTLAKSSQNGECGFGYDPIFILDGYDKSFAVLGDEIKSKISHRATASKKFIAYLNKHKSETF